MQTNYSNIRGDESFHDFVHVKFTLTNKIVQFIIGVLINFFEFEFVA